MQIQTQSVKASQVKSLKAKTNKQVFTFFHSDEEVAIKMIDLKFIKGEVHKNLLANEIEILKLLKHLPNILEFYEVFSTKNNTCIIT